MKKQSPLSRGFTLIEMLVALAILSLIVAIGMAAFDGAKSKAQALVSLSKQMADANIMFKEDVGCFAQQPAALFDQTVANTTSATFCGKPAGDQWTHQYMARQEADTNKNVYFRKISDQTIISLVRDNIATGKRYSVSVSNVPADILKNAMAECNGKLDVTAMEGATALGTYKCAGIGLAGDVPGTFLMQYAETR